MLPNAFINKPDRPTNYELTAALGPAKVLWDQLITDLAEDCDAGIQEWIAFGKDKTDSREYRYDEGSRKSGRLMLAIAVIMTILWLLLRLAQTV